MLSIRYDLDFMQTLVRFADDQVETNSNPNEEGPTPQQERESQQLMMILCDTIDIYCEKRVDALRQEIMATTKKNA